MLAEITRSRGRILLFIDELHTLVGAGALVQIMRRDGQLAIAPIVTISQANGI